MKRNKAGKREERAPGHRSEVAKSQRWTRGKVSVSRVRSRKERVGDRRSREAGRVPRTRERQGRILGRRET